MSEEQLAALLAKLKEDAGLQQKLQGAADLDAAVALAKDAGFDISKADWLKYQAQQTLELSDEELEGVAGGNIVELWRGDGFMEGLGETLWTHPPIRRIRPAYSAQSPCHHRGFLILQPPQASPKRLLIPGTISHFHCRY